MSFKKIFIFLIIAALIVGGVYLAMHFGTSACDHDWVEKRQDNALVSVADCTHAAVYYKCCAKCDVISETLTFEYDEPLGHTVVTEIKEEYLVNAALCTKPAVYKSHCSVCNETLESFEDGKPLGHVYAEVEKAEFRVSKQSCTTPEAYYLSCERCGLKHEEGYTFTVKEALGHTWVEEIHDDHRISETPEFYHKSCSTCNKNHESEIFEACNHNFIEKVDAAYIVSRQSCEAAAVYSKSCEHCGKKHESETFEVGEPFGHEYQEVESKEFLVDPESTCGDTPDYYVSCKHCGQHKENDEIFKGTEPLKHDLTDVAKVAATKTTHGTESHKVCTRCEAYFDTKENEIDAPEVIHNYEWCENDEHTTHYKACTVEGCTAPHSEEVEHTYDQEGCDTTCNGGCGFERESQHNDSNGDGICEKCGDNVSAPEVPKDDENENEDNFSDWMPL